MLPFTRHLFRRSLSHRKLKTLSLPNNEDGLVSKLLCRTYICSIHSDPKRSFSHSSASHDLSGKTAIVTGSTAGIGLGIAEKLAEKGSNIILNGLGDEKEIQKIQDDMIRNHGIRCQFVDADLSDVAAITRMCDHVTQEFPGGVDILVNNAGLQHVSDVENFPVEKWDLLLAVMLSAPFHLTRLLLPGMKAKGYGRIINIASIHGLVASPYKTAYCSAKHGVIGFTKTVALETAENGVTCNAVCPGFVNTEIFRSQVRTRAEQDNVSMEEAKDRILQNVHPMRECVEISQIADLVHFMCTDSCSQMTGSVVTMDAGWTAR